MRVFLPTTATQLSDWAQAGVLTGIRSAHAVTPALADLLPAADSEELEYMAAGEAGEASLRLIAESGESVARRVVLAADLEVMVADRAAQPQSLVRVPDAVPVSSIVSLHVDDDDAEPAVAEAVRALVDGVDGDELAALLDAAAEYELMWFDLSELPVVLSLTGQTEPRP